MPASSWESAGIEQIEDVSCAEPKNCPVHVSETSMNIRAVTTLDRDWAADLVAQHFGTPEIISRGVRHDTRLLPGVIVEHEIEYERAILTSGPSPKSWSPLTE